MIKLKLEGFCVYEVFFLFLVGFLVKNKEEMYVDENKSEYLIHEWIYSL